MFTNEVQLLMESIAWFDMLANTARLGPGVYGTRQRRWLVQKGLGGTNYGGELRKHRNGALGWSQQRRVEIEGGTRTEPWRVLPSKEVLALVEAGLWCNGCPIHCGRSVG